MNLSVSNIGWSVSEDVEIYKLMKKYGYSALEIAPTRIFPDAPYDKMKEAGIWSEKLKREFEFEISSMQSIWHGRKENLFASKEERSILIEYTKKAINFAAVIGCKNLVFGCPRNRNLPKGANPELAIRFFKEVGGYALVHETVIALEAIPVLYSTNYINDTKSAIALVKQVNSEGFRLNLDVGTMIQNEENVLELEGNVRFINHVHISEPELKPIKVRTFHQKLKQILQEEQYKGYISIEMGKVRELSVIQEKLQYIESVFGNA